MFVAFVHVPTVDCVCRLFCTHSPPAHSHPLARLLFTVSFSLPRCRRNGCSINVCCRETNVAWKKQILINQFVNKSKNLSTYLFCFVPAAHIFLYLHLRFGNFFSLHCLSCSLSLFRRLSISLCVCVFLLVGLYSRRDDWWRCASLRFALLSFSLILSLFFLFPLSTVCDTTISMTHICIYAQTGCRFDLLKMPHPDEFPVRSFIRRHSTARCKEGKCKRNLKRMNMSRLPIESSGNE